MKNIFNTRITKVLIIALCALTAADAQVSKGTIRLGPQLAFSNATQEIEGFSDNIKATTLNLTLNTGYFVIDNLELGLSVSLARTKNEVGADEQTTSGTFIGPNLTYMLPLNENFYLPISAGLGLNSLTLETSNNETSLSGLGFGFGTGIEYFASNKMGARFSVLYNAGSITDENDTIDLSVSSTQASIGVNFYFTREKLNK